MVPRAVLVERPSEYDELLARHATHEQVRFFLERRERSLEEVLEHHAAHARDHRAVLGAIPADWRTSTVARAELDRFLFEPDDVVLTLGQDGLVANVAKYLDGQPVIGINPHRRDRPPRAASGARPDRRPRRGPRARRGAHDGGGAARRRAGRDRAQRGVRRPRVAPVGALHARLRDRAERQSSSGLIASTGTGATGWAASINRQFGLALPGPADPALAFFVREAWPSATTATTLTSGTVAADEHLTVICELGEGGVVFGDGIERDRVAVDWGQRVKIGISSRRLRIVVP